MKSVRVSDGSRLVSFAAWAAGAFSWRRLAWARAGVFGVMLAFSSGLAWAAKSPFTVTPDHASGVYAPDEKVTWTVDVTGDRAGLTALPYTVKKDNLGEVAKGTIDLSTGPATITASRGEAGTLVAAIMSMDKAVQLPVAMGGAVISPELIAPARPAPADFDEFWKAKLKELAEVPANPVLEQVSVEGIKNAEGMECYKVTLDNIRGAKVRGILAKPAAAGKYPAILMVNSAGVGPLDKAAIVGTAKPGFLVLNVSAHDLPVDETDAFYKEQKEGALKNYMSIGNESRETSYFLKMLLGCVRGAEYLASRPDWDGKILIVTGISQGGFQSFATAALYPKITTVMTMVPACCDVYGLEANPPRATVIPHWLAKSSAPGRDAAKVAETGGYYDGIYFAERIQCPTLVAVALLDPNVGPAGEIAAYNAIKAPKKLMIMPTSNHYGEGSEGVYFYEAIKWKEALRKGLSLPIDGKS